MQKSEILLRIKSTLWRRYIRSKDPLILTQYKKIRNKVRNITRWVEKKNQNEIVGGCKKNPKHFWR